MDGRTNQQKGELNEVPNSKIPNPVQSTQSTDSSSSSYLPPPEKIYVLDEQVMRTVKVEFEDKKLKWHEWRVWRVFEFIFVLIASLAGVWISNNSFKSQIKQFDETVKRDSINNLDQAKKDLQFLQLAYAQEEALRGQVAAINSSTQNQILVQKPDPGIDMLGFLSFVNDTTKYSFVLQVKNYGIRPAYLKGFKFIPLDKNFIPGEPYEKKINELIIGESRIYRFSADTIMNFPRPFTVNQIRQIPESYFYVTLTYFDPFLHKQFTTDKNPDISKWLPKIQKDIYPQTTNIPGTLLFSSNSCTIEEIQKVKNAINHRHKATN